MSTPNKPHGDVDRLLLEDVYDRNREAVHIIDRILKSGNDFSVVQVKSLVALVSHELGQQNDAIHQMKALRAEVSRRTARARVGI